MSANIRDLAAPLNADSLSVLQKAANTVRVLSMDGVQAANSGHPGMPMGMADVAALLWTRYMEHSPSNPNWADRDRFILSAGHGSMLIYSLLHLTGYDLPLSELKNFRQWDSKTPGHPEYGHTPGVETTTGPLGQGISNSVGFALAEQWLAKRFNRNDISIVDHYTYVIASDGDLMEGISHEACSFAGHLGLNKLIVLYDDNNISIDGPTSLSFSEDVLKRYESYGWHIQRIDGHDFTAIDNAIRAAREEQSRPSIIACQTTIGKGSPNRGGTAKAHGEPLGEDEVVLSKQTLGWPEDSQFLIPDDIAEFMGSCVANGKALEDKWQKTAGLYRESYPQEWAEFQAMLANELPAGWDSDLPEYEEGQALASRAASGKVLDAISPKIPQLIGGSADLTPSNKTFPKGETGITPEDFSGRYIHFGVREHGMGAIMNGMALHGGTIPYGGTFLVFSDYMRGSIRLAALMGSQVVYVFTHDSIGLGEDGPTHQPVEHLNSLRAIPNLAVFRPGDAIETAAAWRNALERKNGPSALVLSRQKLPTLHAPANASAAMDKASKGAYLLVEHDSADLAIISTGSELHIAKATGDLLAERGVKANIVSMPCAELFAAQPESYRQSVLPDSLTARVAVEAGSTMFWHQHVGPKGAIIGIDRFGASAPYQQIYEALGLTAENIAKVAGEVVGR